MGIQPTGQLTNSFGEDENRETQEQISRQNFIPLNSDGLFIDLNESFENENHNEFDGEDLD